MRSLKVLTFFLALSLLGACGNPHLVAKDLPLETNILPMVQVALSGVEISVQGTTEKQLSLGLDTKNGTSTSSSVIVTNLDRVVYEINYSFEKGEHFRFAGGAFPGNKGDCTSKLIALGQCQIDVEFFSENTGVFSDNLKVSYYTENDKDHAITIIFPLVGKLSKQESGEIYLPKMASLVNQNLNMGDVKLGQQSIKMVEIINNGNQIATVNPILVSEEFSFTGGVFPGKNGTCNTEIVPGSCLIEVAFTPKSMGERNARVDLGYNSKHAYIDLSGTGNQTTCFSEEIKFISPRSKGTPSQVVFPFMSSNSKTDAKLTTLYGTEANYRIDNYYTVKDAQVFVSYDLPVIDGTITDIKLDLNVLKVVFDSYKDTEMLCLSTPSLKRCSGHKFALEAWNMLINKNFWKTNKAPINELYEELLTGTEKKCGTRSCMTFSTPVHFSEVFSMDNVSLASLSAERRLNIIISDDTRLLTMPVMEVTVKKEAPCGE